MNHEAVARRHHRLAAHHLGWVESLTGRWWVGRSAVHGPRWPLATRRIVARYRRSTRHELVRQRTTLLVRAGQRLQVGRSHPAAQVSFHRTDVTAAVQVVRARRPGVPRPTRGPWTHRPGSMPASGHATATRSTPPAVPAPGLTVRFERVERHVAVGRRPPVARAATTTPAAVVPAKPLPTPSPPPTWRAGTQPLVGTSVAATEHPPVPSVDVDLLTDQVVRRIERRAIAQRERLGGG